MEAAWRIGRHIHCRCGSHSDYYSTTRDRGPCLYIKRALQMFKHDARGRSPLLWNIIFLLCRVFDIIVILAASRWNAIRGSRDFWHLCAARRRSMGLPSLETAFSWRNRMVLEIGMLRRIRRRSVKTVSVKWNDILLLLTDFHYYYCCYYWICDNVFPVSGTSRSFQTVYLN